ncbi:hypothetical protein [Mucilaginibacter ginsenosidivorans]|uniref:Uncharacterized protein n=1 Tax=Mucilaginibacter ginsenosidivorans TaxID=398053 RepID=A0A5B8USE7_9SPHI|nr:hypothetical protein [Mucilaginibacter ginsenosidivorans]QEC61788.1 hypothetical protein FRZ54_04040 [Mucilaginibacter ginsenosidivorans]
MKLLQNMTLPMYLRQAFEKTGDLPEKTVEDSLRLLLILVGKQEVSRIKYDILKSINDETPLVKN